MKQEAPNPVDDETLHAWVDGRLDAAGRERMRARLQADPALAATVDAWSQQRDALRGLHASLATEAPPAAMVQAARALGERRQRAVDWQRWGGMAASVVIAFAVGWLGHGQWRGWNDRQAAALARSQGPVEFGRQAVVAHVVYTPEVRHPVEVEAAQQEHLVQWLSKRLGRPLKVPMLGEQGYELVGGRLLPGDKGARAQFMYQNAAGERLTLYIGAIDDGASRASGETAFRFTSEAGVASFYWVDRGFGYAMTGKLPRQRLLTLSEAAYRQL